MGGEASKDRYQRDQRLQRIGREIEKRHDQFQQLQVDRRVGTFDIETNVQMARFTTEAQEIRAKVKYTVKKETVST